MGGDVEGCGGVEGCPRTGEREEALLVVGEVVDRVVGEVAVRLAGDDEQVGRFGPLVCT